MRAAGTALFVLSLFAATTACGGGLRRFADREVLWDDPDRAPFSPMPEAYESPFAWDAADQTIFRPVSRFFAVDPSGEARNVNAVDEVPDSSWFRNRLGHRPFDAAAMARGACPARRLDPDEGPWTVTDAKPNGANPGFVIEAADGRKWLLKFDGTEQPQRGTTADVLGSRLYHAAGYHTPCNVIVFFDRSILRISPDAEAEAADGDAVPMTEGHLDRVFSKAFRLADGRYRASGSLFLEGRPIGPFTYQGVRGDDPNDVVLHEDRRDLRGMYVLASLLNHFDSREQNTLDTWIDQDGDGRGWVRHHMIDFGDCLGSLWAIEGISRRLGHTYYLDLPYLMEDALTLGLLSRPWDAPRYGRSGAVFAYFDVESFVPERWRPGYPNPAFGRMSPRDAAWMARVLAHLDDALLLAAIREGQLDRPELEEELYRILRGRLTRLLGRWLEAVSPLTNPTVVTEDGEPSLCLEDLALRAGVARASTRAYAGRAYVGEALEHVPLVGLRATGRGACVPLPRVSGSTPRTPSDVVVDVTAHSTGASGGRTPLRPARVHLVHAGGTTYRVVGLERPYDDAPPDAG